MNRKEFEKYITDTYGALADYPWSNEPEYAVYRHEINRKWFALVMKVPKNKFGLSGGMLDVVNLKCDPVMIGSVLGENGIFPAYHMNKENWLSAALDGSADDGLLKTLLDMSYELTAPKFKNKRAGG